MILSENKKTIWNTNDQKEKEENLVMPLNTKEKLTQQWQNLDKT